MLLLQLEAGEAREGPAADEEVLLVRGTSQLSLHGPPARGPGGSGLLLPAAQPHGSPGMEEQDRCPGPKRWSAVSSLSRPGWGSPSPREHAMPTVSMGLPHPYLQGPGAKQALIGII